MTEAEIRCIGSGVQAVAVREETWGLHLSEGGIVVVECWVKGRKS
jgi:hypothetical protein